MEVSNSAKVVTSRIVKKTPSFGAARYVYWRQLARDIYETSVGPNKMLQSLGLNNGENLNNIVTAVGTAAVAPVFIRYNPIAKEDKNTKAYSAWRQPISAVIALALQLPIMTSYNNMLDRHASTMRLDRMDLSAKPTMAALKNRIKADWLDEQSKAIAEKRYPMSKAAFYEGRLTHYQDQAFYKELTNLRENYKDMKINDFDLVCPDEYKKAKDKVLKEVLEKDFKVRPEELSDAKKYTSFDAFKNEGKDLLKRYNIKYSDFSEKVETSAKESSIQSALQDIASESKVKLKSSQLVQKMKDELSGLTNKITLMSDSNFKEVYPDAKSKAEAIAKLEKEIFNKAVIDLQKKADVLPVGAERDGVDLVLKKLQNNGCIKKIKFHGETLEEVTQSVKLKKFLKTKINRAEKVLSGYKKQSGLIVGLMILPLTCGILNWAYPRIMEKYFPELSAAKKVKNEKMYAKMNVTNETALTGKEAK